MNPSAENYLKTVRFETPDHIPMKFHINDACWRNYDPQALFDLCAAHPLLFPDFRRPTEPVSRTYARVARRDEPYTDDFGCVWSTTEDGITGTVTAHPLADWSRYADYVFPDPARCTGIGPIDWAVTERTLRDAKASGGLAFGALRHGHTFLQLCDLRGYENLSFDFADDRPEIHHLIAGLEEFNAGIVSRYLEIGVDVMGYAEDLGMQRGPMVSPAHFRRFIQPSYRRLMKPARDRGTLVHMHSDGDLHDLIDDIVDGGVDILNLQDLVNGIDWIGRRFAGRTCIELDIDRQSVTALGTPAYIDRLIRTEVETLGSRRGGLMMIYGLYPGVPLDNVAALMDAMERYAGFWR